MARHEVLIGAPGENGSKGRAYVLDGADLSILTQLEPRQGIEPLFFDRFGASVAGIPDADGDGLSDYAIGAPFSNYGGTDREGTVFLRFCALEAKASVLARIGGPPNPNVFATPAAPLIGETWTASVDHTTFMPSATTDLVFISTFTGENVPSEFGTILLPFTAGTQFFVGPAAQPFDFALPTDCTLVGVKLSVQAAGMDAAGISATNVLDVVIGNY